MEIMDRQGEEKDVGSGQRVGVHLSRAVVVLVVMGLIVYLLLPRLASLRGTWQVLRGMSWWGIALAVAAQAMSYVGAGYLLQEVVALTGQSIPLLPSVLITLAGQTVGLVSGGLVGDAAVSYRWSRAYGLRAEGALLGGWLPSVFNLTLLALLAVFGLGVLFVRNALSPRLVWGLAGSLGFLAALVSAGAWLVAHPETLVRLAGRLARRLGRLPRVRLDPARVEQTTRRLLDALGLLRRGHWVRVLLGAAGNVGFDFITVVLLFHAAGQRLPMAILVTGYGLPLLFGKLFILPGGVGIIEGGMVGLYRVLGVPLADAVLVTLAYRTLSFWLPMCLGFPLIPLLEGRVAREGDAGQVGSTSR